MFTINVHIYELCTRPHPHSLAIMIKKILDVGGGGWGVGGGVGGGGGGDHAESLHKIVVTWFMRVNNISVRVMLTFRLSGGAQSNHKISVTIVRDLGRLLFLLASCKLELGVRDQLPQISLFWCIGALQTQNGKKHVIITSKRFLLRCVFAESVSREGGGPFCPWWRSTRDQPRRPGPRFNIKMSSYQFKKSHCGDKTSVR